MADRYFDFDYRTDALTAPSRQCTATITAISKAASAVVTAANDFASGERVTFTSVGGMTEINNLVGTISAADATGFTVGIDSTGFTTYTSGGTATKQHYSHLDVRVIYDETLTKDMLICAMTRATQRMIAM